jgi:hypothetical protein
MARYIPLLCVALLLSGCGASLFGPEPGLTNLEITMPDGMAIDFESGKEYGSLEGNYEAPNGVKASFKATAVEAFPGQKILLEMQRQQLATLGSLSELLNRLAALYTGGGLIPHGPAPEPAVQ